MASFGSYWWFFKLGWSFKLFFILSGQHRVAGAMLSVAVANIYCAGNPTISTNA